VHLLVGKSQAKDLGPRSNAVSLEKEHCKSDSEQNFKNETKRLLRSTLQNNDMHFYIGPPIIWKTISQCCKKFKLQIFQVVQVRAMLLTSIFAKKKI